MLESVYELFKDEIDARWKQGFASGEKLGRAEGVRLTRNVFRLSSSGASTAEIAAQCNISEDYVKEILN